MFHWLWLGFMVIPNILAQKTGYVNCASCVKFCPQSSGWVESTQSTQLRIKRWFYKESLMKVLWYSQEDDEMFNCKQQESTTVVLICISLINNDGRQFHCACWLLFSCEVTDQLFCSFKNYFALLKNWFVGVLFVLSLEHKYFASDMNCKCPLPSVACLKWIYWWTEILNFE